MRRWARDSRSFEPPHRTPVAGPPSLGCVSGALGERHSLRTAPLHARLHARPIRLEPTGNPHRHRLAPQPGRGVSPALFAPATGASHPPLLASSRRFGHRQSLLLELCGFRLRSGRPATARGCHRSGDRRGRAPLAAPRSARARRRQLVSYSSVASFSRAGSAKAIGAASERSGMPKASTRGRASAAISPQSASTSRRMPRSFRSSR